MTEILAAETHSASLRIAIVDDEPDLAVLYSKVLQKLGHDSTSIFHDGTSLVRALTSEGTNFDVILMDYRIPEMDGIEAAKIIQRYRKDTKIIMISGYEFVKDKAAEVGLTFLSKPFSIRQLAQTLDRMKD